MRSSLNLSAGDSVHLFLCLYAAPGCVPCLLASLLFSTFPWVPDGISLSPSPCGFLCSSRHSSCTSPFGSLCQSFNILPCFFESIIIFCSWSSGRNDASALRHYWSPTHLVASPLAPATCGRGRKRD